MYIYIYIYARIYIYTYIHIVHTMIDTSEIVVDASGMLKWMFDGSFRCLCNCYSVACAKGLPLVPSGL